jgi:hypothetical protein
MWRGTHKERVARLVAGGGAEAPRVLVLFPLWTAWIWITGSLRCLREAQRKLRNYGMNHEQVARVPSLTAARPTVVRNR